MPMSGSGGSGQLCAALYVLTGSNASQFGLEVRVEGVPIIRCSVDAATVDGQATDLPVLGVVR
jgi:hypothetical protein